MVRLKQVILVRRDLNMRRGKEIAQGSHASMAFLAERVLASGRLTEAEEAWLRGGMAKVCLKVNSEEELLARHRRALEAGLPSHLILDSGRTEFNGVPTHTSCAIGPADAALIDAITGDLILY